MAMLMGSYAPSKPFGTGATLPGAPPTNYNPAYGGIPQVPNPVGTAGTAISGNIGNLNSLYQLGGGVDQFAQGQLQGSLASAIPNYAGLTQKSSQNIASELGGQLPTDVVNTIIQNAAERGIMTGSPGSPNSDAAMMRALGLSSLNMTEMGQKDLATTKTTTPFAQPFDISRMFVSPEQQQQAEAAAALYKSAPVPSAAAGAAMNAAMTGLQGPGGPGWSSGITGVGGGVPWRAESSPWETGYSESVGDPSTFNMRPAETDPYAAWSQWAKGIPSGGTGTTGGGGYYYDPTIGGYVDYGTGSISDTPGGDPWSGFSAQGVTSPAIEANPYE